MQNLIINAYLSIFTSVRFLKFNKLLFNLSVRCLGILNCKNLKTSGELYLIEKVLPNIVKKTKPIFFDVGANIGGYSEFLLKKFPNATIYAFEPHPQNYKSLKNKFCNSTQIKMYNVAVSNTIGMSTLYDREDYCASEHASLYEEVITDIHNKKSVSYITTVDTLDHFVNNENIGEIDYLKIDTEGNELNVLQGAECLIRDCKIKCIHFEFNEMNIVSRVFLRDFKKKLKGYEMYRLLPDGLIQLSTSPLEVELFAYQNVFAIARSVA